MVTSDRGVLPPDTIYLTMGHSELTRDVNKNFYITDKLISDKIDLAAGSKLVRPYSVSVDNFFNDPFYPAIFKNIFVNGGLDKFLIETPEQLDKIKKLRDALKETSTDYNTSLRVLASASGNVMAASLKYARGTERREGNFKGLFEHFFSDTNSKYFLNSRSIISNHAAGGLIFTLVNRSLTLKSRNCLKIMVLVQRVLKFQKKLQKLLHQLLRTVTENLEL